METQNNDAKTTQKDEKVAPKTLPPATETVAFIEEDEKPFKLNQEEIFEEETKGTEEEVIVKSNTFKLPPRGTIVEVRPIERTKWHGKHGQESFQRPKKFQVLVDTNSMTYATGLTEEEIEVLNKYVKHDLGNHFNQEEPHPFWDSPMALFKMENNTMFFDISYPLNYIKVKNMKASKYIANSMAEWEQGLFPDATHVIFDESEQAEILASKVQKKQKAIIEAYGMTKDRKIEIILALDNKNMKGQSNNFIDVALDKLIEKDPEEFLRYSSMSPDELTNYAIVLESLQKSVLRKDGHNIMYHESVLGMDEVEVAKYLLNPANQDLKIRLLSQIN